MKYIVVDREPIVGDLVKIVDATEVSKSDGENLDYKNGDILKIIDIDNDYETCYFYKHEKAAGFGNYLYRHEFIVVEEIK